MMPLSLFLMTDVLTEICLLLQIFTTAAHDAHKNIVFLSFEMVEKIIRDYFPHITETETTTFTDCVNCLVAFTNSKFEKDISLQAISFLQYCARKLAEGSVGSSLRRNPPSSPQGGKGGNHDSGKFLESDEDLYSWFPLLAGKPLLCSTHLCISLL